MTMGSKSKFPNVNKIQSCKPVQTAHTCNIVIFLLLIFIIKPLIIQITSLTCTYLAWLYSRFSLFLVSIMLAPRTPFLYLSAPTRLQT